MSQHARRFPRLRIAACASFALAGCLCVPTQLDAQGSTTGAAARAGARDYRQRNEAEILEEFSGLLALPNLASDSAGIRRNADHLIQMLGKRGFSNTRLLTVPGGPPAVDRKSVV